MTIDSSVYAFVDDFVDAGPAQVAEDLAAKGFSAVSLATVYHASRDLLPHNPKRVVAHRSEGVHYFPPDESLYTGPLKPQPAEPTRFGEVTEALVTAGLSWQAWTVYLHNCRLAIEYPEYAVANAFGDRYITDLCPSSDVVAGYAENLTADVARLRPSLIVAESLHHAGFGHGYHHERAFVGIDAVTEFLLSLCFCDGCAAMAGVDDVDAGAVAARVRGVVRSALADPANATRPLDRAVLAELCGEELLSYLKVRQATTTRLAGRCARVARAAGVRFGFMDQTGALKGYVTGEPAGRSCADDAWQLGIAPVDVARDVDAYVTLAYAKQAERVASDVGAYATALGEGIELRCVLRHGGPDYADPENLEQKVEAAVQKGASGVDFYHYGLMPISGLAAASSAVRSVVRRV